MTDLLIRPVSVDPVPPVPRVRRRLPRPGPLVAGVVVVLVALSAFVPDLLAPGDPLVGVPAEKLRPPSPAHWFGTDYLGRDLFTRVVHGASLSLQATVTAVAIALVVGGLIGLLAGFAGRWVDETLMRVVDVLLSIPPLLLSLALITALGYGRSTSRSPSASRAWPGSRASCARRRCACGSRRSWRRPARWGRAGG